MAERVRTQIRRAPHKQVSDPSVAQQILKRAILAHVAVMDDGAPYCLPVACAPYENELLLHGSNASRLFKLLASGVQACATVTLVDALVLAASAFDSSMHYQSLMAFGSARVLEGSAKEKALDALTDHLFPQRRAQLPQSTSQELAATMVLSFPLNEISLKVSNANPEMTPEAKEQNLWVGVVPITRKYDTAHSSQELSPDVPIPEYISTWPVNRI